MKPPKKPRWDELDARLAEKTIDITAVSAEQFIEDPDWCDLPISPGQRALIRASEGLPVTHLDPLDLEYHLGTRGPFVPPQRPSKVACRSGRRSGKSLILILLLCLHALRAKLRRHPERGERAERDGMVGVGHGERVRLAVVAARLTQSIGTFQLAISRLQRSPMLRRFVEDVSATRAYIRRDDGQRVEIEILAAASRGANLRSGWFIGCVLDEADFFGEADAAISLKDQFEAVEPALVTGGQIMMATSPWDDAGHFAKLHAEAFGKPNDVLAFHSSTQRMNPTYPVDKIEALRRRDPDFVSREYDAVPMVAGGDQFFPEASIIAACTRDVLKLEPSDQPHWFGADPGLRKNSATLAGARANDGRAELAYYEELIPQKKTPEQILEDRKRGVPPGLAPSIVFRSFAETALRYKATCIRGDQYYEDSAIEHMPQVKNARGDTVYYDTFVDNTESTADIMTRFRSLLNEGKAILPRDPRLMQQMRDTKSKKGANGKIQVVLPRTGAAHGDLLKAVVLAMVQVPLDGGSNDDGAVGGGRRRWGGFGSRRG